MLFRSVIGTLISISGRPTSLRYRPPIQLPRQPRSSRHRSANIRSSGALWALSLRTRKARLNCAASFSAAISIAPAATGFSNCKDCRIASTIRRIHLPSNTLAIPLGIPMAVGRIFQQRTPCLRLAQSHCERVSASTRIPNTDLAWTLDALCPCKWRIGVVTKGACCWGGVHRFYAGIEGVIQHSSPCRSKNGASHRKNFDTPPLGGNCRETCGRSGGTILAFDR